MYKESQINSGKGHGTGAASLPGVTGRAQIPHIQRCENTEKGVFHCHCGHLPGGGILPHMRKSPTDLLSEPSTPSMLGPN